MKKLSVTITFLLSYMATFGQLEFSKWYFGFTPGGINFATNPPSLLPNNNSVPGFSSGNSTICDNNGNLLFYCDGFRVFNSNHVNMANSNGLNSSNQGIQAAQIVKQPGNNTNYYIFHADINAGPLGYNYSIVDMSLAAGLGSVTAKNVQIYTPSCQRQVAIRHCNGKDVWMLSQENLSNNFRAYLLTQNGVSTTPVISSIGFPMTFTNGHNTAGVLKVSPDGKKVAMAVFANPGFIPSHAAGGFQLFDFDAATGVVSNSLSLLNKTSATSVEFSPDGTKLYGTCATTTLSSLHQWNICAQSTAAILASQYSLSVNGSADALQRAIDGKIYLTSYNQANLHVINSPNNVGAAMSFSPNAFIFGNTTTGFLPNYINTYTRSIPSAYGSTLACNYLKVSTPPVPTFTSGCSSTPYVPSSYKWDFGDPSTGAVNTSTSTNASHFYSATGTYTASLILYSACTNDTIKQVIQVNSIGPNPVVTGNMNICKGERHVYTVSGGNTYTWSGSNATGTTQALTTNLTTQYVVSASANGCTLAKTFTVNVNNCTGLQEAESSDTKWVLYPNPSNGVLHINSVEANEQNVIQVKVFNSLGALVLEQQMILKNNTSHLNTEPLSNGIYTMLIDCDTQKTVSKRFVVSR